jgi:hypothetical protein
VHAFCVRVLRGLAVEVVDVEPEVFGVRVQVRVLEMSLVFVEVVVRLSETALCRRLGGLGGLLCMRM